jgi:hypothetical protein
VTIVAVVVTLVAEVVVLLALVTLVIFQKVPALVVTARVIIVVLLSVWDSSGNFGGNSGSSCAFRGASASGNLYVSEWMTNDIV